MSSKNQLHSVFFFRNQLLLKTKPAKVVKAVCSIGNVTEVDTVQSIDGFYRIDVKNTKAQRALLLKGITVEGLFVPLMELSPDMIREAGIKKMVKVLIGNLPSTANINNNQIVQAIEVLGVKIRSPITPEFHKDPESHASLGVKTGRLIIYIDEPDTPLPEFVNIGERKASIYYYGQKREYAKGSAIL